MKKEDIRHKDWFDFESWPFLRCKYVRLGGKKVLTRTDPGLRNYAYMAIPYVPWCSLGCIQGITFPAYPAESIT